MRGDRESKGNHWNSPRRWGGGKRAVSRVWFEEKASWLWWYRLKIGPKTRGEEINFKGVLRKFLNSLKKRDVKVEIERNKNWEYREIKRETISEDK